MIVIFKTACFTGATLFVKPVHVVTQPMLTPVAWDGISYSGDTSYNLNEDVIGVVQVSCSEHACAGLKTDGSVVGWDHDGKGADT